MSKRVTDTSSKSKIDDKEDLEIKKVAYANNYVSLFLLVILIVLFALTLFCSIFYISRYYEKKYKIVDNAEIIQVSNIKSKSLISNNGPFEKVIDDTLEEEELTIESYANVEVNTRNDSKDDGKLIFDVKYVINKNEFASNAISNINSDVIVRFAYSFDNENWEYIDNVISTPYSTLNPVMSHFYDMGGLVGEVNVATNYEIISKPGESKRMYWKSETVIRNRASTVGKVYNANFKIEYKESA